MPNLILTALTDGRLINFSRALRAAGMVDALSGSGPFTLFAPTDAAFALLPAGLFEQLVQQTTKEALTQLMTRHTVANRLEPTNFGDGQRVQTIDGQWLTFSRTTLGLLVVDGAAVVDTLNAANGFIYVLDAVLMPR